MQLAWLLSESLLCPEISGAEVCQVSLIPIDINSKYLYILQILTIFNQNIVFKNQNDLISQEKCSLMLPGIPNIDKSLII